MNTVIKKYFRVAGGFLLALLGFSSCDTKPLDDELARPIESPDIYYTAYGVPLASYHIYGKVKSSSSRKAIKGIQVQAISTFGGLSTPVYTDSDGKYSFVTSYASSGNNITINFKDVDGPDNGGEYASGSITVTPKKISQGDGFSKIEYEAEANVKMKKK